MIQTLLMMMDAIQVALSLNLDTFVLVLPHFAIQHAEIPKELLMKFAMMDQMMEFNVK